MKTSGISSATAPPPGTAQADTPARRSFALTGRTVVLDPKTNPIRRDIADIRLADRVFAPHYAVPMPRVVAQPVALRAAREQAADVVADLKAGETFEILEIAGNSAWGLAVAHGLVGYVDKSALDLTA